MACLLTGGYACRSDNKLKTVSLAIFMLRCRALRAVAGKGGLVAKNPAVADVVEEIFESILATPKRQRRLLSKTFWGKFRIERRTAERVEEVREALRQRDLILNIEDAEFGKEDKGTWLILSHVRPSPPTVGTPSQHSDMSVPTPPNSWFEMLKQREFESEREVEYYFIVPLLEQLGYEEDDFAIGYPVQMYEGVKKVHKEADFVLFNGPSRSREDALLIVEAKKTTRTLTEDAVGQARAYAMWLITPYYIVTNADDIQVWLFRGAMQPDVKRMGFKRSDLREHWTTLYETMNKAAVVDYKQKLRDVLTDSI